MVDTAAIRCNRTADCQRNDIVEISTALQNWRRETIVMPPGGDMQHYYYYNLYCCHNFFVYQVSSTVHTAKLNVSDVNCCEFTLKLLMTVTRVFQWRRCRLQEDQSATGNDDKRASSVGSAQVWHRGNFFTGYCLLVVLLPAVLKTSCSVVCQYADRCSTPVITCAKRLTSGRLRADNGSHFVTRDPHCLWPITQSQTMVWVDHDYSRLLPSLLCNDVQSRILDSLFSEYFIVYTVSLIIYTLRGNFYELNTVNSSLIFL